MAEEEEEDDDDDDDDGDEEHDSSAIFSPSIFPRPFPRGRDAGKSIVEPPTRSRYSMRRGRPNASTSAVH